MSNELISESSGGIITKTYQYSPWGQRQSQTTHNTDGTTSDGYYSYNDHSDVEAVTGPGGNTTPTYGYPAHCQDDTNQFTRPDKPRPPPAPSPPSHSSPPHPPPPSHPAP